MLTGLTGLTGDKVMAGRLSQETEEGVVKKVRRGREDLKIYIWGPS